MRVRLFAFVVFGWLAACAQAPQKPADPDGLAALADETAWTVTEVGDGVFLRQRLLSSLFGAPQSLTVLEISADGARFDVVAPGKRTKTSAMGRDGGALAAINGGYFDIKNTGLSIGLLRLDGKLVVPANEDQASLGIGGDGTLRLATRPAGDWPEVHEALGAGPMLLLAGGIVEPDDRSRAARKARHPRSAVGRRADGTVVWLAVDGRLEPAAGMTFSETARVMHALGCVDALNLDGGGSTTLWVAGRGVCNHPCDDKRFDHEGERTVANALLLHAPAVVVVDDDDARLDGGGWSQRTDGRAFRGADFASSAAAGASAVFEVSLPFAGRWRVLLWSPEVDDGGGDVLVSLPGGAYSRCAPRPRTWTVAGELEVGDDTCNVAHIRLAGTGGELVVDGVRLVQLTAAR